MPEPALAVELTPLVDDASVTLDGCRLPSGAALADPTICPDDYYTTGNLGKSWNELDLVPHRVIASDTGSFEGVIAADNEDGDPARPGYDYMSEAGPQHQSVDRDLLHHLVGPEVRDPRHRGHGRHPVPGCDAGEHRCQGHGLRLRLLRPPCVGIAPVPRCVPALEPGEPGPEPGGVGARDVSIPVNEIEPQELDKSMTADPGA